MPQQWSYSRIDRLPKEARCEFCHRALTRPKGIVIVDEEGVESYAGPNCAKKRLGDPDERLLDVSRYALMVVAADETVETAAAQEAVQPAKRPKPVPQEGAPQRAAPAPVDSINLYVRLRAEHLKAFKGNTYKVLSDAYTELTEAGEISQKNRKLVGALIRNANEANTVFSEQNVKRCLGLEFWLQEAIEHTQEGKRDYLESMLKTLHSIWSLSAKQLAGINGWGNTIRKKNEDFPLLDTTIFDGIVVPDLLRRSRKKPQE